MFVTELMAKGDRKGVKAWQQVANALESQGIETVDVQLQKCTPGLS